MHHVSQLAAVTPGPPADRAHIGLALFALSGSLWITQALPLTVTALLVPVLAVLSGLSDARTALAPFAHPIIFLFLGGFALAAALLVIANAIGLHPASLAAAVALASSCAFMLPVATPPNAIVFGTGEVSQPTMMRCGPAINLVCIAVISVVAAWAWS